MCVRRAGDGDADAVQALLIGCQQRWYEALARGGNASALACQLHGSGTARDATSVAAAPPAPSAVPEGGEGAPFFYQDLLCSEGYTGGCWGGGRWARRGKSGWGWVGRPWQWVGGPLKGVGVAGMMMPEPH